VDWISGSNTATKRQLRHARHLRRSKRSWRSQASMACWMLPAISGSSVDLIRFHGPSPTRSNALVAKSNPARGLDEWLERGQFRKRFGTQRCSPPQTFRERAGVRPRGPMLPRLWSSAVRLDSTGNGCHQRFGNIPAGRDCKRSQRPSRPRGGGCVLCLAGISEQPPSSGRPP